MFCIAAEFKDVPLRDSHVLQKLPRGVRRSFYFDATELRRKVLDDVVEGEVRVAASQKIDDLLPDWIIHSGSFPIRDFQKFDLSILPGDKPGRPGPLKVETTQMSRDVDDFSDEV